MPTKRIRVLATLGTVVVLCCIAAPARAAIIEPKGEMMSSTNGIAYGPDGNFWVAEMLSGTVARVSPAGAVLDRYTVGANPAIVVNGPGGRVWVSVAGSAPNQGKLVWFDALSPFPAAHDVPTTAASDCPPYAIAAGGDGRLYFSLPPQMSCTTAPRMASIADDGTGAIAFRPDRGTVLDLALSGGKLFAPDATGNVVRRLALGVDMTVQSTVSVAPASFPAGVAVDDAGDVWVTEYLGGRVARFPATQLNGSATEITPVAGTLTRPFGIVKGADGRMYIAGTGIAGSDVSSIARVGAGGTWEFFKVPAGTLPYDVTNGPDGDVWFGDVGNPRILRFRSAAPRVASGSAEAKGATAVAAAATVDPRGNDTTVVFEYGPTAAYGSTTPALSVPAGTAPVDVATTITKLARRTTYHVRARATNAEGTEYGPDVVVRTPDLELLEARLAFAGATRGQVTTISRLRIINLSGGETAVVRCSGKRKGCSFARRTYGSLKPGGLSLSALFGARRKLRPGARITVQITAPNAIGKSAVLTTRSRRTPKIVRQCLAPGSPVPSPCPAR